MKSIQVAFSVAIENIHTTSRMEMASNARTPIKFPLVHSIGLRHVCYFQTSFSSVTFCFLVNSVYPETVWSIMEIIYKLENRCQFTICLIRLNYDCEMTTTNKLYQTNLIYKEWCSCLHNCYTKNYFVGLRGLETCI